MCSKMYFSWITKTRTKQELKKKIMWGLKLFIVLKKWIQLIYKKSKPLKVHLNNDSSLIWFLERTCDNIIQPSSYNQFFFHSLGRKTKRNKTGLKGKQIQPGIVADIHCFLCTFLWVCTTREKCRHFFVVVVIKNNIQTWNWNVSHHSLIGMKKIQTVKEYDEF